MKTAYVNGEFVNAADAKISVFDRGFLFGDGVYEVLPVHNGRPLFVDRHLKRLHSNLEKTKIQFPNCDWANIIQQLIEKNGSGDLQIYIQITRGNQEARKHDIPFELAPTVVAFTLHLPYASSNEKEPGLRAKLMDDNRWLHCDIKATSLLGNILLNDDAVSAGFDTSILSRNGFITESSTANVFIVTKDGKVKTPPLSKLILPGITREILIELIKELGFEISEEEFDTKALLEAQEVWITSTTKGVYPVTKINDTIIGEGHAGNYWRALNNLYQNLVG